MDAILAPGLLEQAVEAGLRSIMTPYPGTALHERMRDRLLHQNWDLYDTRHVVYQPRGMTPAQLEQGYWRAYKDFYRWGSILRGASTKDTWRGSLKHAAYSAGRKKFEPFWNALIRAGKCCMRCPFWSQFCQWAVTVSKSYLSILLSITVIAYLPR